ncbi:hypothetical protein PCL_12000 [Purpureocillium lilacinum]|uniref:Uncharacterized protein n=1 Tax=Purpureocillium lilacinum TaxID=33203 RepID=A0A2U3EBM0_PURLI|nr:hypothetical protein PCL_12000 [Purpureocillium lilacinum]
MIGPESGCYPCSRISKLAGGANRAFSRWSRLQTWHSIVQAYPTDQGHLPESTHWQSPGDLLAGRHQLRDAGAACLRPRECPGIHVGRAPSLVGCDPLAEMWSISKLSRAQADTVRDGGRRVVVTWSFEHDLNCEGLGPPSSPYASPPPQPESTMAVTCHHHVGHGVARALVLTDQKVRSLTGPDCIRAALSVTLGTRQLLTPVREA